MDYHQLAAQLVATINIEIPGVKVQPGVNLVGSNVVPQGDESGYNAWLTYRNPRQQLFVQTPALSTDRRYWQRLAVGQDMLIHYVAPFEEDPGEVYAYYRPHPDNSAEEYYIAGKKFGPGMMEGYFDRWMRDYQLHGVIEARNGVSIHVTAVPARFAIVLKFLHYNRNPPGQPQYLGLEGLNMGKGVGGNLRGAGGGKMLGRVQTTPGTAQYREIQRVLYVLAYPTNNVIR